MRRIIVWTIRVLAILIVAGVACEPLLFKSRILREFVIHTVAQELDRITGGRADIKTIELESSPLTAYLHDITIRGRDDGKGKPFLHVEKVTARLSIRSLLRRQLALDELVIDHPALYLVGSKEGNIPQHAGKSTSDHGAGFELNIRHLLLSNGEVSYQQKNTQLDAEFFDLGIEIRSDSGAGLYKGSISYENGLLRYLNYTPVRHDLTAKFNATSSSMTVESLQATVGSSTLSLRGQMTDFSNPNITADYGVRIHTQDIYAGPRRVVLTGDIFLSGKVRYQNVRNRPLLLNLSLEGLLRSDGISVSSPDALLEMRALHAQYRLTDGIFQARNAVVEMLGGHATIDADIQHLNARPTYRISASLRGFSLQAVQQAIRLPTVKRVVFVGTADGTSEVAGSGSELVSRFDLLIRTAANEMPSRLPNMLPVNGAIHLTYNRPQDIVTFRETKLRISSTTLAAEGEVGDRCNLRIHALAPDLHELATLVSSVRPFRTNLKGLSGSAELKAMVQGAMHRPRFTGKLSAHNLRIGKSEWRSATAAVQVDPSELVLQSASFVGANQGKASLSGTVRLRDWSYLASNPIRLNVSMQRLSIAGLQDLLNLEYPASGELSGDINFHGSELDPSGSGRLRIVKARVYDESLQDVALEFRGYGGSVNSTMNITMAAGSANLNVSYIPAAKTFDLSLGAPSLQLEEINAVRARSLPLSGVAKLSATGHGGPDKLQLTATIDVPHAQFRGNPIAAVRAEIRVADQKAEVRVSSQIAHGSIDANGYVNLTGDYYCEAAINTGVLQLEHLLDFDERKSGQSLRVQTQFQATLKGPLKDSARVEGHLTIATLNANYESLQLGAAQPVHVEYARSVLNVEPAEFRGSGTSLRMHGSIPLAGSSTLSLGGEGYIDASVLRIINPDLRGSGVLALKINTSGSVRSPSVQGEVQLREVALSTDAFPIAIDKLSGALNIENNRVRVSNVSAQVGGGDMSLTGSILYWPSPQFDLTLQAKSVRLRYPTGFRMLLNSHLALTGKSAASTLSGRVLIDDLSFTPEFDVAKLGESLGGSAAPRQASFGDSVKLAVAVQSQTRLNATSSLASAEGDVNLRVIGTLANPVIIGRTDLTSGEVFFRSRRYQFERGIVVFNDPNRTRPALDLSATTTVQQYHLTLNLRGFLDKLNMSYASDPPLPTADIINLIAVGRTTQEGEAASRGTDSILASQAAGQVSTKMQNLTGISGLRIDPLVGGSNRDPSARIAIQQRVTKNFLFTFSTDVSQAGAETVEGKYQINKRWSIGVARDQVGGIAVDGRYHTKF